MTHYIPPTESSLHTLSEDCKCKPHKEYDEKSGEYVCIHLPIKEPDLTNFIQI